MLDSEDTFSIFFWRCFEEIISSDIWNLWLWNWFDRGKNENEIGKKHIKMPDTSLGCVVKITAIYEMKS